MCVGLAGTLGKNEHDAKTALRPCPGSVVCGEVPWWALEQERTAIG